MMTRQASSMRLRSWWPPALVAVGLLLAGGFAFRAYRTGPSRDLIAAAESGDVAGVRAALAAGADVDYTRKRTTGWQVGEPLRRVETALLMASGNGHAEIVRELLAAGADPDILCTGGSTALVTAAGRRGGGSRTEIIHLLLNAGATPIGPTSHGYTALEWATVGQLESVPLLLAASKAAGLPNDVEARLKSQASLREDDLRHFLVKLFSTDGFESPIQSTARKGSVDDLVKLLDAGADANTQDADGWTPLHWAAGFGGDLARTSALLEAGSDPNARTDGGWTPLMVVAQADDPLRVRTLLNAGADPNAVDKDGWTALHVAAWRAGKDVIRLLLQAGARSTTENGLGQTPAELAEKRSAGGAEDVTDAFISGDD